MQISDSIQDIAGLVKTLKGAQGGGDALNKLLSKGSVIEAFAQGYKDGKVLLKSQGVLLEALVQTDSEISGRMFFKVDKDEKGNILLRVVDESEFAAFQANAGENALTASTDKLQLGQANMAKNQTVMLDFENMSPTLALLENATRNDSGNLKIIADANGRIFAQDANQTKIFIPELESAGLKFPAEYSISSMKTEDNGQGKLSVQLNLTSLETNKTNKTNVESLQVSVNQQSEFSVDIDKNTIIKLFDGFGLPKDEAEIQKSINFLNNIGITSPSLQHFKALASIESLDLKPGKEMFLVAFDAILQEAEQLGENMFKSMQAQAANSGKFVVVDVDKNPTLDQRFLLLDTAPIEMTDDAGQLAKDIGKFLESMRITGSGKHQEISEVKEFLKTSAADQAGILTIFHELSQEISVLPRMLTAAANMQVSAHGFEPDTGMNYMLMSFPFSNGKEYMPNMVKITYKGKDAKKKTIDWKNCKVTLRLRTLLLGMVCIDMSFNAARLNCQLLTENRNTEMIIGQTIDTLSDSLKKSGFNLGSLKVSSLKKEKNDLYTGREERQAKVRHAGIIDLKV